MTTLVVAHNSLFLYHAAAVDAGEEEDDKEDEDEAADCEDISLSLLDAALAEWGKDVF